MKTLQTVILALAAFFGLAMEVEAQTATPSLFFLDPGILATKDKNGLLETVEVFRKAGDPAAPSTGLLEPKLVKGLTDDQLRVLLGQFKELLETERAAAYRPPAAIPGGTIPPFPAAPSPDPAVLIKLAEAEQKAALATKEAAEAQAAAHAASEAALREQRNIAAITSRKYYSRIEGGKIQYYGMEWEGKTYTRSGEGPSAEDAYKASMQDLVQRDNSYNEFLNTVGASGHCAGPCPRLVLVKPVGVPVVPAVQPPALIYTPPAPMLLTNPATIRVYP